MFDENNKLNMTEVDESDDDNELETPPVDEPPIDNENDEGNEDETPTDPPSDIPCVIKLKKKFPEVEWWVLTDAYEQAVTTLLDKVFPFRFDVVEIPEDMPRLQRWVYDCAKEILAINNIADGIPLTMYKENGITMEWDSSMMSASLRERIPPPWIKVVGRK